MPTQQKGPTERGPKGLENFLVSGTIIVTLVTGTIPRVCTTESGHAVPSHASPKAGRPEKPVRDPEMERHNKYYGARRGEKLWVSTTSSYLKTIMKLGSLLTKGGGGLEKIRFTVFKILKLNG